MKIADLTRRHGALDLSQPPAGVFNVVDDVPRECLAGARYINLGRRVVRELTTRRGTPGRFVSDDGTKLTSNAVLAHGAARS